jgi:O-antigen ligase
MVASVPLVGAEISLLLKGTEPRHSIPEWLLRVSMVLAPLFVAVAVFWFDLCFLRKDKEQDHTNSEIPSGGTGP